MVGARERAWSGARDVGFHSRGGAQRPGTPLQVRELARDVARLSAPGRPTNRSRPRATPPPLKLSKWAKSKEKRIFF